MKTRQIKIEKDRFKEYMTAGNYLAFEKMDFENAIACYTKAYEHSAIFKGDIEEIYVALKHLDMADCKLAKTILKQLETQAKTVVDNCILVIMLTGVDRKKAIARLLTASKMARTDLERQWVKDAKKKLGIVKK
jgi:hypothetical protein